MPAARVPAAPPNWTGNCTLSSCRPAAATPWNHCAARSPNVKGSECWVRLLPTHSVSACCSARAASAAVVRFRSAEQRLNGVAGQQHQGGVQHVLAGQRGVHGFPGADAGGVQRLDLLPQVGQQRDHGVAAALGTAGDVRRVVAARLGGGGHDGGGTGRRQARLLQHGGPAGLDGEDRRQHRTVPRQRRHQGRRRDGTEQAGVAVGRASGIVPGRRAVTGSPGRLFRPHPAGGCPRSGRRRRSRRAISVLRRSGSRELSSGSLARASAFSGR